MADTRRTLAALQTLLADNSSNAIVAQAVRDFLVSVYCTVQIVSTQTGAVATGSTVIPVDNTIPQNTEGDEYMTLAITPVDAANDLLIEVEGFWTQDASTKWTVVALFQDTTAGALKATAAFTETATAGMPIRFRHRMTAGTTSPTTFKVRAGPNAASTTTFNGQSGGRLFGGVCASSITISEILA